MKYKFKRTVFQISVLKAENDFQKILFLYSIYLGLQKMARPTLDWFGRPSSVEIKSPTFTISSNLIPVLTPNPSII